MLILDKKKAINLDNCISYHFNNQTIIFYGMDGQEDRVFLSEKENYIIRMLFLNIVMIHADGDKKIFDVHKELNKIEEGVSKVPTPRENESRQEFIDRCMSDREMRVEFPDPYQRYAVCEVYYDREK